MRHKHPPARPPAHRAESASPARRPVPSEPARRGRVSRPVRRNRRPVSIRSIGVVVALGLMAIVAPTVANSSSVINVAATQDAYVSESTPTRVNDSHRLVAGSSPGNVRITYLTFNVESVPTDTRVVGATLKLTRDLHHLPSHVAAWRVDDTSWSETTLTMNNAPEVGAHVGEVAPTRETRTVEFPVDTVRGNGTYSFAITSGATDDVARFRSAESDFIVPQLEIEFTESKAPQAPTTPPPPEPPAPSPSAPAAPSPTAVPTQPASPTPSPSQSPSTPPAPPAPPPPPPPPVVPPPPANPGDIWVGAAASKPRPGGGIMYDVSVFHESNSLVGPLTYRRSFDTSLPASFASSAARNDAANGFRSFVSWKPPGGDFVGAAQGKYDDAVIAWAKSVPNTGVYATSFHEPENDMTGPQFVALQRHLYTVVKKANPSIQWGPVYMTYWWNPAAPSHYIGNPDEWWPGDEYADFSGADNYVEKVLTPLETDGEFRGWYDYMVTKGVPLLLSEYGVYVVPAGQQADPAKLAQRAQIIAQDAAWIRKQGTIRMWLYWDAMGSKGDWRMRDAASQAVWRQIAASGKTS